ncbi:PIN domain-containing protein [Roseofilum sp. BLCC_M154]|uniref:PIN domain-containing protein n=1 Tax=Roseofilum acuticapitatum BLCC-M154 TaxID=3022444 RepID=A0ABT7ASV4_9CYAN|nr:PIN domain-containing protein [Roseofilum acuticapitatum]MDJ1169992.1 PIN domain-containing protein [Roseofilum acuticapitatum BLCC-M154]
MTDYLLDTNVVLRLSNPDDRRYHVAREAVRLLLNQGDECFLTAQVLIELWVVATRPVTVNGLGWTPETTHHIIDELLDRFPLLEESPEIFYHWLDLVTGDRILGKRTHDARLVAVMISHHITHILTFNPRDFMIQSTLVIVDPQDLVVGE